MKTEYNGYTIQTHRAYPQCVEIIKAGKGGSISTKLTGTYTNVVEARVAIDQVIASKPVRGKSNAKAESNG